MKAFVNPLLLIIGILLLVSGSALAPEGGGMDCEGWVLFICLLAVIINGTLGLARALTQQPSLQSIGWAVVFLLFGSSVWTMTLGRVETLSSEERAQLRRAVADWHEGRANPYALDEHGDSILVLAAGLGKKDILADVLENPAGAERHPEVLARAAHRAAERNRAQSLRVLVAAGVPADVRMDGLTPLHTASLTRAYRSASCLLELGAQVNAGDADGATPLHHAVIAEDRKMVQLLLRHGADPAQRDADGRDAASYSRQDAISEDLGVK